MYSRSKYGWSWARRPVSVCDPKLSRLSTFFPPSSVTDGAWPVTGSGQRRTSIETEPEHVELVSSVPFRLCWSNKQRREAESRAVWQSTVDNQREKIFKNDLFMHSIDKVSTLVT